MHAGAVVVVEEIRRTLKEKAIPHAASPVANKVTLSMGIAMTIPTTESSSEELLSMADKYLY